MDPRSLDAAAKALAQGLPRRSVLVGLLGLAAASIANRLVDPQRSLATQDACDVICLEGQVLDETCACVWIEEIGCGALTDCGGFCVDTYADPFNCGSCGFICESGICTSGSCAEPTLICDAGLVDCFGTCADLLNDPFHCGACGVICDSGLCLGGACDAGVTGTESPGGCTPPLVDCLGNGACLDLAFDPDNCGACGIRCESGICTNGVCQTIQTLTPPPTRPTGPGGCAPPFVPCSGECVDLTSDARNCGRCGTACRSALACDAGVCSGYNVPVAARSICPANHEDCGDPDTCSLLTSDPENCGACGNACLAGELCIGGACCKPQRQLDDRIGFVCVPPSIDCGALLNCGGVCVDVASDPNHCGQCGNACRRDDTCSAGRCVAPPSNLLRPPPQATIPVPTCCAGQSQEPGSPAGPEVAWVRPLPEFTGDCLYFAARARPRRSGAPQIESVVFTVRYQGTDWIDACTASQPSPDDPDLYECTWDHDTRRAVEGPVSVGFTVVDADGTRVRADADRHGEFRLPSTEPALQLPMQGNIRVVGNLPGSGDHLDADEFAVDLESDDPAVYPTAPGTVVYVDDSCESGPQAGPPCFGITVAIDHGGGWYSIYAHLADDRELPAFGDEVDIDTRIGTMSDSGCYDNSGRNLCGSKHLHFAVHKGVTCRTGEDSLWETTEPVDVWTRIPGLPNPPATGPVAT